MRSADLRKLISKSKEGGFKHHFEVKWYTLPEPQYVYMCVTVYSFYGQLLNQLTADSVDSNYEKVTEQMNEVRYMDRLPGARLQVAVILCTSNSMNVAICHYMFSSRKAHLRTYSSWDCILQCLTCGCELW